MAIKKESIKKIGGEWGGKRKGAGKPNLGKTAEYKKSFTSIQIKKTTKTVFSEKQKEQGFSSADSFLKSLLEKV